MVYGHLITTETHQYYQYSPPQFSKKFSTNKNEQLAHSSKTLMWRDD